MRSSLVRKLIVPLLLCLFFVGLGASIVVNSLFTFPHRYAVLSSRGVRIEGTLVKCGPGIGGGNGTGCEVHITFKGFSRTWDYPENSPQFNGMSPGDRIPMLVDPANPNDAYTVLDVRDRTNTGFGVLFSLGCAFILIGLGGLWWTLTLQRRVNRKVKKLSEPFEGSA